MKKRPDFRISRFCMVLGALLLVAGALLPFLWQWGISSAEQKMAETVHTIRSLIPTPRSAFPEPRRDNTMPMLSLEGVDFLGILEMPRYGLALPVCGDWGEVTKHPCRFAGSAYDRSLQIGGTNQKGQFDFYQEISVGDLLYFTDMEGNRYTYTVTDLRYEKHANQTALQGRDGALKLFIKNLYGFDYLIVFCDVRT